MSPEDLAAVDRSWAQLRRRRGELLEHLTESFGGTGSPELADQRARWLVHAVTELVGLLTAPSRLATRARSLAASWPVAGTAPTFGVEGRAWMDAARDVGHEWTDRTDEAWRHAWLLLSEVLAEDALSPFAMPRAEAGPR